MASSVHDDQDRCLPHLHEVFIIFSLQWRGLCFVIGIVAVGVCLV